MAATDCRMPSLREIKRASGVTVHPKLINSLIRELRIYAIDIIANVNSCSSLSLQPRLLNSLAVEWCGARRFVRRNHPLFTPETTRTCLITPLADLVHYIHTLDHLTKGRVHPVKWG